MSTITPTKFLQLPYQFDVLKLQQDVALLLEQQWIAHFNTKGYDGDWKAIPLYAPNGDASNIQALSNSNDPLLLTTNLKACSYLNEVIETFQFPLLSARLLKLSVGAYIKPHKDHKLGYEDGYFRLHIPIITNKDVHFMLDNTEVTMQEGECWYTNVNYVHSVRNQGVTDRIHLVIDGRRDEWSDNLFFSLAPKESLITPRAIQQSPETIKFTIRELERSNMPIAQTLIKDLKEKLALINDSNY
ncbi:aspartyl/asparaginyl beta-hydroxylase domain-containing protein [Aquimarina rhabdastrellae]